MPRIHANSLEFEYDTFGDASHPPVLLIMGLGAQMINWHEGFCGKLASHGLHVIRFDNRDIGLSSKLDTLGTPDFAEAYMAFQQGEAVTAPYLLDDMADDAAAVARALGHNTVHLCGASMGGMIAQLAALRHPGLLSSLTIMQSTTGASDLPDPEPDALAALIAPQPETREDTIRQWMHGHVAHNGTLPLDESWSRDLLERLYDRNRDPDGVTRQMVATLAASDRTALLGEVVTPTLVVHGAADPLIPPAHGEAVAAAIPGATLRMIDGWGHPLTPVVWDEITDVIAAHVLAVEAGH